MKDNRLFTFFFFLAFSLCASCGRSNPPWNFKPSFYYWKTSINLDANANQSLRALGVDRLYVRLFDVTWDFRHKAVVPNSPLNVKADHHWDGELVPVIYLTREALIHLKPSQTPRLAGDILKLTRLLISARLKKDHVPELQLDCDWTRSTKDSYFGLLQALGKRLPKAFPGASLSCTIRLSQVKYRSAMGVPPVNRGVLMVYHTASPGKLGERDTILDLKDAQSYLSTLRQYPLPMDVALPVFSWAVLFQQDGKPLGILNDTGLEDLKTNANFTPKGHNVFVALRDTYLKGRLVQKDWQVRVDEPGMGEVEKTVRYLKPRLRGAGTRLILFHWDDSMIGRFTDGKPERLSEIFGI